MRRSQHSSLPPRGKEKVKETSSQELRERLDMEKAERARERQRNASEMLRLIGFADKQAGDVEHLARKFHDGAATPASASASSERVSHQRGAVRPSSSSPRTHAAHARGGNPPTSPTTSTSSGDVSDHLTSDSRAPSSSSSTSSTPSSASSGAAAAAVGGDPRDHRRHRHHHHHHRDQPSPLSGVQSGSAAGRSRSHSPGVSATGRDGGGGGGGGGEVARLRGMLEGERREHRRLIDELEQKRQDDLAALWDEHWHRVHQLEDEFRDRGGPQSDNDLLREAMREMERENRELHRHIEAMSKRGSGEGAQQDTDRLKAKLRSAESKNQKLLEEVAVHDEEIEALRKQADDALRQEARMRDAQQQLIAAKQKDIDELRDSLRRASRSEAQLRAQQQLLQENQEKTEDLLALVDSQKHEIAQLQAAVQRGRAAGGAAEAQQRSATPAGGRGERGAAAAALRTASAFKPPTTRLARRIVSHEVPADSSRDDVQSQSQDSDMMDEVKALATAPLARFHRPAATGYSSSNNDSDRENTRKAKLRSSSRGSLRASQLRAHERRPQPGKQAAASERMSDVSSAVSVSTPVQRAGRAGTPTDATSSPARVSRWRSPAASTGGGSSRLEQLRSELQEARSERLMMQTRRR